MGSTIQVCSQNGRDGWFLAANLPINKFKALTMLKISLPINPYDLGYLLSSIDGYIDMQLAEVIGCSIVAGTKDELDAERQKSGLPLESYEHALGIHTDNYKPQVFSIPLHRHRTKYIGALVNAHNEQASKKDIHIKYSVVASKFNRYKELTIIRYALPGKHQSFEPNLPNEDHQPLKVSNVDNRRSTRPRHKLLLLTGLYVISLIGVIAWTKYQCSPDSFNELFISFMSSL